MPNKETGKKRGRPAKVLTEEEITEIESLAGIMCSWGDIAHKIGWKEETLKKKEEAKDAYHRVPLAIAGAGVCPLVWFSSEIDKRAILQQTQEPVGLGVQ